MINFSLPIRKHPIHLPNIERNYQPIIVFLTVCTHRRHPVLAVAPIVDLLEKAWKMAQQWRVGKFIVMPDHVHLFCAPSARDAESVQVWSGYWKSLVCRGIQGYGPLGGRGATRAAIAASCGATDGVAAVPPFWQRDVWDTQLKSGESYHEKWEYVRRNPVRKFLVNTPEEWPFQGELNVFRW